MTIEKIPFKDLPLFHKLIQDYLTENDSVKDLISEFPSKESLFEQTKNKEFPESKRQLLVESLNEQYKNIPISSKVKGNLDLLLQHNTHTVTTGHQLCLASGPLYVIIKISAVIALTKELNEDYPSHNFVPVFWMATEDHDFEEINHFHIFNESYKYETNESGPVGRMNTKKALLEIEESFTNFNQNYLSKNWWSKLREAYNKPTLTESFRSLINDLFSAYGLIIIDGDHKALKSSFVPIMTKELIDQNSQDLVNNTIDSFKDKNYKVQVNPREINLFYIHDNGRDRIIFKDSIYKVLNTEIWFENIENELILNPDKFSPNVILRPLYQEFILPNIAMIGGGGELSYWLELKNLFDTRSVEFPILILRDSVLFLKKKSMDFLQSNNIHLGQLFKNQEKIKKIISRSNSNFNPNKYKEQLIGFYEELAADIGQIDIQLKVNTEQNKSKALKELENLTKRLDRVLKSKSEVELKRFNKIIQEVFPQGIFQERWVNPAEIMLIFEVNLIDELISNLQPLKNELTVFIK